ncbi:hypothetical protein FRC10_008110 [Ceratobasidium sp. 414]|nr:hypothetical protein FRC10_008110 [Ceratobasidium sp. 414]
MTPAGPHLIHQAPQVFSIPELATLISSFCTAQDCARLLRTCRLLYKITIPFVWEHVDGARQLLSLVIAAFEKPGRESRGALREIDLVGSFRIDDPFPRFDIYAPHVRSLNVYGHERNYFKVSGWRVLISHAQERVLLPNLHTLTIQTSCDRHGPDQPMWVGAFASPSLVNLLVVPGGGSDPATVSYSAAAFILDSLMTHRPKLQKLGLFPNLAIGDFGGEGESGLLAFLPGDPFYEYLDGTSSLRHLSSTLAWFQREALPILGQLPHLETMSIYSWPKDAEDHDFEIDDNLFPSLTGLNLYHLAPWDVERVIRLRPLIKGLKSLFLETNLNRLGSEEDPTEWLNGELFPLLKDAPHITDLNIKVKSPSRAFNVYEIGESVLTVFSRLPLECLSLDGLILSGGALNVDLGTMWQCLTRLQMPSHHASFAWLLWFAAIPSLQYLEVQLDLQNEHIVDFRGPGQPALTTLVTGSGGKISPTFSDIDLVAR